MKDAFRSCMRWRRSKKWLIVLSSLHQAVRAETTRYGASIVNWKYEPGFFDDKAYGYAFYTMKNLGAVSEVGPWQVDSLWQAYMAKVNGSSSSLACP